MQCSYQHPMCLRMLCPSPSYLNSNLCRAEHTEQENQMLICVYNSTVHIYIYTQYIWRFPKLVVPPIHPELDHLSTLTYGFGNPPFQETYV